LPPRQKPASMAKFKRELRRETRRRALEPEINYLNITAMLDMMTIILVFLLKSMSASTASVPQNSDLTLPKADVSVDIDRNKLEPDGLPILVSKTKIIVGRDKVLAEVTLPADLANGAAESDKTKGRGDKYIVPLGQAVRAWRDEDKPFRGPQFGTPSWSEAVIMADRDTPYRLLYEVLYTLGQNEFGEFHLMVMNQPKP